MPKIKLIESEKIVLGVLLAVILTVFSIFVGGGTLKACSVLGVIFLAVYCIKIDVPGEGTIRIFLMLENVLAPFWIMLVSTVILNQSIFNRDERFTTIKFICCLIIIWMLICFFGTITANSQVSIVLSGFLVCVLTTANHFVYEFRGRELQPIDLLSWKTAANVANQYQFEITPVLTYGWYLFIIGCVTLFKVPRSSTIRKKATRIKSVVAGVIFLLSFSLLSRDVETHHWMQQGSFFNGYLLNFTLQLKETFVRKPEGYSVSVVEANEKKYASKISEEDDLPTIITIMDESFSDWRILNSDLNTSIAVTPFLDSLTENTIRGYALSSVFGGNTPNSEYEYLTGHSFGFLPENSIAYQQYVREDAYSIVSNMKMLGYRTIAMHPYKASGWSRPIVYPYLGFDESYFEENFEDSELVREFVSDQAMFEKIIELYESKKTGEDLFLFGVTMQNHGGYEDEEYTATVELEGYSKEYPLANQYLSLLNETDKAMQYLISYFEKVDEEVVIVFYGDHFPGMETGFYEEIYGKEFETLDEQQLLYQVPFMIWTNYDIEEKNVGLTSLNFLSNYFYEVTGISMPSYNQFLQDVSDVVPAMNAYGYYSVENECFLPYEEATGREKEILELYSVLQYNAMFDKKNKSEMFFGR